MQLEVSGHLGAERYERTEDRKGQRDEYDRSEFEFQHILKRVCGDKEGNRANCG